jgi:hypothetical protein
MDKLPHLLSFRGEMYSLEHPDTPDSAIFMSAFALRRSTTMYSKYVKAGYVDELGRSEKRGRSSGA